MLYEAVFYPSNYLPYLVSVLIPVFYLRKGVRESAASVLAVSSVLVITYTLKYVLNVPRPGPFGDTPSFPSGHAALSFAHAGVLKNTRFFWPAVIYAVFVSAGRVLTLFHRPEEVIAGAIIGYLVADFIFTKLLVKFHRK